MNSSDRASLDVNFGQMGQSIRESGLLAAGAFATCVALAAFASTQIQPTFTADGKLLFTRVDRTAALTTLGETLDPSRELQSLLFNQTPLTTQIEVIRSRPLLQKTIEILELKDDEGQPLTPETLDKNLELNIIGGADVVEILFTNPDPQVSASVVNTLIHQYRENSLATSRAEAREAKEFLLAQLPQTEATVRQAEVDLRDFLERNQIGVLDEEATSLVARIETLSNEIATVQANLEAAGNQSAVIGNKLKLNPQEALTVGVLSQNPGVQEAIVSLQEVERELATQQARFSPNSPVVRQLKAQQESLQAFLSEQVRLAGGSPNVPPALLQGTPNVATNINQSLIQTYLNTEVEYSGLQRQLDVLRGYQQEYQRRLSSVPSLSAEQRALERRVAVAEETYSALLARLQELQVQENEVTYNSRIIQPATVPEEPNSGAKLKVLALGVGVGTLLAIGIIIVSEVLRSKSSSRKTQEVDFANDFETLSSLSQKQND